LTAIGGSSNVKRLMWVRLRSAAAVRLCVLVAIVFLVGDLLGFMHQSAQVHVVCPEHGELIHGEASEHRGSFEKRPDILASASRMPMAAPEPAPRRDRRHDGDDHCPLCPSAHDPLCHHLADAARTVAITEGGERLAARASSAVAVAVYRTAPKTSPPLA
jgi:hypothetical protein